MNKDTKLLFFDIDGTLITEDERRFFPESAKAAIKKAREMGHLAFINTGRVYVNIEDNIKAAGFDGYVCGCGTNIIYHGNNLLHNTLSQDLCRRVAYKCRELGFYGLFEHRDKTCIDTQMDKNEFHSQMVEYFSRNGRKIITEIEDIEFLFDKFSAWYDNENNVPEMKRFLEPWFDYIDREGCFCEIVPKGFSKATGIRYLLDYFDLPLENAYAFGDGNNDASMLLYVKNSVLMEKGPENLKKQVKLVTENVEQDGIFNAMKKLEII